MFALFKGFKMYIYAAAIAAIFIAGWTTHGWKVDAAHAKELAQVIAERDQAQEDRRIVQGELDNREIERVIDTQIVEREVIKYVSTDPNCDIVGEPARLLGASYGDELRSAADRLTGRPADATDVPGG